MHNIKFSRYNELKYLCTKCILVTIKINMLSMFYSILTKLIPKMKYNVKKISTDSISILGNTVS